LQALARLRSRSCIIDRFDLPRDPLEVRKVTISVSGAQPALQGANRSGRTHRVPPRLQDGLEAEGAPVTLVTVCDRPLLASHNCPTELNWASAHIAAHCEIQPRSGRAFRHTQPPLDSERFQASPKDLLVLPRQAERAVS
jgi:hypothetical protein